MQQERQHLFGGDQGGSESEGGGADEGDGGDTLPAPLANPQVLNDWSEQCAGLCTCLHAHARACMPALGHTS